MKGEIGNSFHKLLYSAVMKGFLTSNDNGVNLVNASILASELGVKMKVIKHADAQNDVSHLNNAIELIIENEALQYTLTGKSSYLSSCTYFT